jgi:hypothetical protein
MKYIAQPNGTYTAFDEASDAYAALQALPVDRRPTFLSATSEEVKAYLAAQAEAAKPKSITARQAHEALIRKGLRDNIVNAITGIPDPVEQALADNWFQRSNTFERNNETLVSIAGAIGLTSNDVDNLFAYAATL